MICKTIINFKNEEMEGLPGYLSLHLNSNSLILKWTPNQLMNGALDEANSSAKQKKFILLFELLLTN
jgi:hypothetical protein